MTTINRTKLITLVNATKGRIFTAVFVKKDGTVRTMNCRKGVKAFLRGGENKVVKDSNPYITVFEMAKKEYRTLNLATVVEMKFAGETYVVV